MAEPSDRRLPALTGLRFFAAACIVVLHNRGFFGVPADFGVPFAFVQAVTLFFMLSGFILAYNYPSFPTRSAVLRFWLARWARIWPAHVAALVLLLVAVLPFESPGGVPRPSASTSSDCAATCEDSESSAAIAAAPVSLRRLDDILP